MSLEFKCVKNAGGITFEDTLTRKKSNTVEKAKNEGKREPSNFLCNVLLEHWCILVMFPLCVMSCMFLIDLLAPHPTQVLLRLVPGGEAEGAETREKEGSNISSTWCGVITC